MNQVKVIEQELYQCLNDVPCQVVKMNKGENTIEVVPDRSDVEFLFDEFDTQYQYKIKKVRTFYSQLFIGEIPTIQLRITLAVELRKSKLN